MTNAESPLPRTVARITAAVEVCELDGVKAEIHWTSDRSFQVAVPRRWKSCPTDGIPSVHTTQVQIVGHLGWYVRDGRNHIVGTLDNIERALANVAEGHDALAPRRSRRSGTFPGRDRSGRFARGSQS